MILSLVEIIDLIKGVFQFPATLLALIKVLRKTPEEKHEDLLTTIQKEAAQFEDSGRPTW